MTSNPLHQPLPDAVYRLAFGGGINLPHGALVASRGKLLGAGQEDGVYDGAATLDPATGVVSFDIGTRVPMAYPFATGLKAGPAGSSLRISARGAAPTPVATFPVEIVGHRGTMTLELIKQLDPLDAAATPLPHPDAFPDGVYRVLSAGAGYTSRAVAVLRAGQFCASGEKGGRYIGRYEFDLVRKATHFDIAGRIPPMAPLVVGGAAGSDWLDVPIKAETKFNSNGRSRFSYSLFGRAVDAEILLVRVL